MRFWPLPLFMLLLTACSPDPGNKYTSHGLVYCVEANPETFNPQLVTSGTVIDVVANQLYDKLISINPDTGEFLPGLATAWSVSNAGTKYTFSLRKNVQFHQTEYFKPSRPFNADDVVFTFSRILDDQHPYHEVNRSGYPFFASIGFASLVRSIQRDNDYQVSFELHKADSSFLANLATAFSVILSEEYGQQLLSQQQPERLDSMPIGTGPFKFRSFVRDHLIRYYRHEQYWRYPVTLEQMVFDISPNPTTRMAKMLTHECDVMAYPVTSQLDLLRKRQDINVREVTSMNVAFWAFNTLKPPFNDPNVRRALAHAVNIDAIIDAVYFGEASKAQSLLPQSSWGYQAQINRPEYNPELARTLLAEAKLPKDFVMTIWAMPVQRIYNPNAQKMAELIQADLKAVGIQSTIVSYEWNTFLRELRRAEHDSVLIGWSADNMDPDNFFSPLLSCAAAVSGNNRSNWCYEPFEDLLTKALASNKVEQRKEFYYQAQAMLMQQLPLVPIAHSKRTIAEATNVSGVVVYPFGGISLGQARKD